MFPRKERLLSREGLVRSGEERLLSREQVVRSGEDRVRSRAHVVWSGDVRLLPRDAQAISRGEPTGAREETGLAPGWHRVRETHDSPGDRDDVCPPSHPGSSLDVERIRVPAERNGAPAWSEPPGRSPSSPLTAEERCRTLREVQSRALLLTRPMAPTVYEAAELAMDRLGVKGTVEIYQSDDGTLDNAFMILPSDPLAIEFRGGFLGLLDSAGLLAVLGHEIGHALAHPSGRDGGRRATMASELTADRFGLLACRDLYAALRVEMQLLSGRSASVLTLDPRAYLATCQNVVEETLAPEARPVARRTPSTMPAGMRAGSGVRATSTRR